MTHQVIYVSYAGTVILTGFMSTRKDSLHNPFCHLCDVIANNLVRSANT